jgi:hypothetical protein
LAKPRPAQSILSFWVVNDAAHLKIAVDHLAILISSTALPAKPRRRPKRRLIGTVAPMTLTTLMWSRSTLPLAGSPTPTDQGDHELIGNNQSLPLSPISRLWLFRQSRNVECIHITKRKQAIALRSIWNSDSLRFLVYFASFAECFTLLEPLPGILSLM